MKIFTIIYIYLNFKKLVEDKQQFNKFMYIMYVY